MYNVIVIGGGILQIPMLETIKSNVYYIHLFDGNPSCEGKKWLENNGGIDTGISYVVDIKDHLKCTELARDISKKYDNVICLTQGCDAEYTVAWVNDALAGYGPSIHSAYLCNNKIAFRKAINTSEYPELHVPFIGITNPDDIDINNIINKLGDNIIIKPSDNCASRGTHIVKDIRKHTTPNTLRDKIIDALDNCKVTMEVIIEPYFEGNEYSVDTFYEDMQIPCGISDRIFMDFEGYAVQKGSITPSLLPSETQEKIYEIMDKCAKVIGIRSGAFKGDILITNNGDIKVIEVTARTSGGFDSQYRKPLSYGIDMMQAVLNDATMDQSIKHLIPKWMKWSMTTTVFPKSGKIKSISGINKVEQHPSVIKLLTDIRVGDTILPYTDCAKRIMHIIITADTYDELMQLDKWIQKTIEIKTEGE